MDFISFVSNFLPFGLLEHFEIKDFQELGHVATKTDSIYIFLDEENELPSGYDKSLYQSKAFIQRRLFRTFLLEANLCVWWDTISNIASY